MIFSRADKTIATMTQPPLPFPHFRPIPATHARWFHYANAAEYGQDKEYWFYPFKSRFLARRAIPDGLDMQRIKRRCRCGDGIFRGRDHTAPECYWQVCWHCSGTSIYRTDRVLLARWILNGTVYHCPVRRLEPGEDYVLPIRDTIDGLVNHTHIPSHVGRACMSRLLLRYEPREWLRWQRWRIHQWWYEPYWNASPLRKLIYDMQQEWNSNTEEYDPIPF